MAPQLRIETRPDGRLNIYGLAMWSTGTFHGHGSPPEGDKFTEADLDAMQKAHEEVGSKLKPRMYAGHPLNPMLKMLARPQGTIKKLYRNGSKLYGDLEGVDKTFWEKAQSDDARFSPDVKLGHRDPETGKRYPYAVVGLGVLGAVQPANGLLPSLSDYQVHYYSDAAQQRAYGDGSEIRSYAGLSVPASDTTLSPRKVAVLNALREYTANGGNS